jgi:hypothetical protein
VACNVGGTVVGGAVGLATSGVLTPFGSAYFGVQEGWVDLVDVE